MTRHAHVHQHDVRRELAGERHGLPAVGRLTDDLDPGLGRRGSCGSPARTSAWSSASRTRIIARRRTEAPRGRRIRPRRADRVERATDDRDTLAQADQAVARAVAVAPHRGRRRGSRARRRPLRSGCARAPAPGPACLSDVRERLLHDAVRGEVDAGRQLDRVALDVELDREARPPAARSARSGMRASDGSGARASSSSLSRSSPSRRRISPSACSPVRSIASNARRESARSWSSILRPPRACTTTTAIACAITSWSSRAIRCRSSTIAASACAFSCSSRRSRVAPQTHHHAREPRAAHDEDAEHDVAPHEAIAVVPDELRGDRPRPAPHRSTPGAARVRADRVEREDADDDEDRGLLVEARRDLLEQDEARPHGQERGEGEAAAQRERERGDRRPRSTSRGRCRRTRRARSRLRAPRGVRRRARSRHARGVTRQMRMVRPYAIDSARVVALRGRHP